LFLRNALTNVILIFAFLEILPFLLSVNDGYRSMKRGKQKEAEQQQQKTTQYGMEGDIRQEGENNNGDIRSRA
jgi:hypothetical protein